MKIKQKKKKLLINMPFKSFYLLLFTSFVNLVSSHRYENVDCTIILEGSVDTEGPFPIESCYTSFSPYNKLDMDWLIKKPINLDYW